ncbi:MAG: GHKL domain-containing protein [Butyrivibrio sp.]|nr:GHKL domain-containing protein [Butyrivibrio sp.]
MNFGFIGQILSEIIIFLCYAAVCVSLMKRRLGIKAAAAALVGLSAASVTACAVIYNVSHDLMLVLTLLPVTAYLPFSVGIYLLGEGGLFRSALICAVGVWYAFMLKTAEKIISTLALKISALSGTARDIAAVAAVLAAALGLLFYLIKYLRAPFRKYVEKNRRECFVISVPTLMVLLLFSYFLESAANLTVLILLLATSVTVFMIISRLFVFSAKADEMRESKRLVSEQMELQRHEYEKLYRKNEAGRIYRHDMRHNLSVLEQLAQKGDTQSLLSYIGGLKGALSETGQECFCENPAVNAVLSSCISRAREAGCRVNANILMPRELPFDEIDICALLANALDNALNACLKQEEGGRYINIEAELLDNRRAVIAVVNPCTENMEFDAEGFPIKQSVEGHGVGLRSIGAVAAKYNGFFKCECGGGRFSLRSVLFAGGRTAAGAPAKKRTPWIRLAVCALILIGGSIVLASFIPISPQTLESAPLSVSWIKYINVGWGDSKAKGEIPEFSGDGSEEINSAADAYVKEMRGEFLWYLLRRYDGYVSGDIAYTVIRNDESLFSLRFDATVNAGGSGQCSRFVTLDKKSGSILKLSELFEENGDYVGIISGEILRQMKERKENGEGDYFIPGGIWSEDECFKRIDEEQNFYINDGNELVIVFDEYEVAPGKMGMPEFVIPSGLLEGIAVRLDFAE